MSTTDVQVQMLPRKSICPGPDLNPRKHFDQTALEELADSIRAHGIQEPILCIPRPDDVADSDLGGAKGIEYWIYAGERRWRAAELAELDVVPVIVRDITYADALGIALVENLQRADLTPVEEARGIAKYMEANPSKTQHAIAASLGYTQPWLSNRLRLLELRDDILDLIDEGVITPTSARDHLVPFTRLTDPKVQAAFFDGVVKELLALSGPGDHLPRPDHEVHRTVTLVATPMSRSIRAGEGDYIRGVGWVDTYIEPTDHQACGCGGPSYKYGHRRKGARCFNLSWWKEANAAAKKRIEEERAARAEEEGDEWEDPDPAKFEWDRDKVVPADVADEAGIDTSETSLWPQWLDSPDPMDAAELPLDKVYRVEGHDGRHSLVCTDIAAVHAARKAGQERRFQALRERRLERGRRDRQEADDQGVEFPWALAVLLGRAIQTEAKDRVLDDLFPDTAVEEIPIEELQAVVRVLAIRVMADRDVAWRDPLEGEVEKELAAETIAQLRELLPAGWLPIDQVEEEEEEEEADEAEAGEDAEQEAVDEIAAMVTTALDEKDAPSIEELYGLVKAVHPEVEKLTLRQFNARHVLPIKRQRAQGAMAGVNGS